MKLEAVMASSVRRRREDLQITYDAKAVLGRGFQSVVFQGSFSGKPAAVKRLPIAEILLATREEEALRTFNHPNILKLFGVDADDVEFKFFALELCAGTLEQFCSGEYQGPMPTDEEALHQMATGLLYIHQQQFIHRDIKPQNVLVSFPGVSSPVQLKIADFGFCKQVSLQGSASMSNVRGTENWYAPELLPYLRSNCLATRCNIRSDIFSMGCVFGYFLTRGIHPFGTLIFLIMARIYKGEYDLTGLEGNPHQQIVEGMIHQNPEHRMRLEDVLTRLQNFVPQPAHLPHVAANRPIRMAIRQQSQNQLHNEHLLN